MGMSRLRSFFKLKRPMLMHMSRSAWRGSQGMRWGRGLSSETAESPVAEQRVGQAHVVELNRPKALNALSWEMVRLMQEAYTRVEREAAGGAEQAGGRGGWGGGGAAGQGRSARAGTWCS